MYLKNTSGVVLHKHVMTEAYGHILTVGYVESCLELAFSVHFEVDAFEMKRKQLE